MLALFRRWWTRHEDEAKAWEKVLGLWYAPDLYNHACGLCYRIEVLEAKGEFSEYTAWHMRDRLHTLSEMTGAAFLWPRTPDGDRWRKAYCRFRIAELRGQPRHYFYGD